jgi:hypothetical protein
VANPVDNPDLYEAIELGGRRSPGKVELSGHDRAAKWDVKTAKGKKGGTTTLDAIAPIEFTATFTLSTVDEFDEWGAFSKIIRSTIAGTTPKAIDIYHPDLAEQDITSVVQGKIVGRKHDGKGGQVITVTFQEYLPPKPKGGTASGSKKSSKAVDPNQAALDELAALTAQYKETPWG